MSRISPDHFQLLSMLIAEILKKNGKSTLSILDIGGGAGEYWLTEESLRLFLFTGKIDVTVLDAQIPTTQKHKKMFFLKGVVPSELTKLEESSFDLVIAFDVIEHLKREDGYLMLYEMERVASQACSIFTPNGFVYQKPEKGNPFNAHISGWKPRDLKNFGWGELRGHSGLKAFFGVYGLPKRNFTNSALHDSWILLLLFSQILVFRIPRLSFAFSSAKWVQSKNNQISLSRINQEER